MGGKKKKKNQLPLIDQFYFTHANVNCHLFQNMISILIVDWHEKYKQKHYL